MNIKYLFTLFIIAISLSLSAQTQTWQWVKAGGSSSDNNSVQPAECKIAGCDAYGNIYAVGMVNGSNMAFDTFSSGGSYSQTGTGGSYLLFSYDCAGNMRWAKQIGDQRGNYLSYGVVTDPQGNTYFAGSFSYGNNRGTTQLYLGDTVLPSSSPIFNQRYLCMVKYDSIGHLVWFKNFESTSVYNDQNDYPYGLRVGSSGNLWMLCQLDSDYAISPNLTTTKYGIYNVEVSPVSGNILGGYYVANGFFSTLGTGYDQDSYYDLDANENFYQTGTLDGNTLILATQSITPNSSQTAVEPFIYSLDKQGNFRFIITNGNYCSNGSFKACKYDFKASRLVSCWSLNSGNVFGNDTFNFNTQNIPGGNARGLFAIDTNGNILWGKYITETNSNSPGFFNYLPTARYSDHLVNNGLAIYNNTDTLYNNPTASSTDYTKIISQIDQSGNLLSTHLAYLGSPGNFTAYNMAEYGATDWRGNVYLGGTITNFFSTPADSVVNTDLSSGNFFIAKLGISDCSCPIPGVQVTQVVHEDSVYFYGSSINFSDSISWRLGDGTVHTGDTFTHVYPNHDSTYTVTAIAYSGCGIDSITKLIAVTSCPVPGVQFTQMVHEDTVYFYGTATNTTYSIHWILGDGGVFTGDTFIHAYVNHDSTYAVTAVAYNGCGMDSITKQITVTNCPTPGVQFTQTVHEDTVYFYGSSINHNDSIRWRLGDGTVSSLDTFIHAYANHDSTYTVTAVAYNGCGADTITKQITVTSCPTPGVQFTQTIKGDTVYFYGTITNTSDSIEWRLGDGSVHTGDTFTHVYAPHDSTYIVTAKVYGTCGADSLTRQITVTVCPTPGVQFTETAHEDTVYFYGTTTNTTDSIRWRLGDGSIHTGDTFTHVYPSHDSTYAVTASIYSSCGADSITSQISVTSCPIPGVQFTQTIKGDTVYFYGTATIAADSIHWRLGDGSIHTGDTFSHIYSPHDSTYPVSAIAYNGCGADTITRQITVTVCPTPAVQFTQIVKEDTVYFYGSTTNTTDSIHWRLGDGSIHTGDTFTHVYPSHDSTYAVTASVYSSCGADSITRQITVSSCPIPGVQFTQTIKGDTVYFYGTTTNTADSIHWRLGDGSVHTGDTFTHVYAPHDSTYTVTASVYSSCGADSITRQISVTSCPIPGVQFTQTIKGDTVYFYGTITNTADSIHWRLGDGSVHTGDTFTHIYAPHDSTYSVTATIYSPCGADSTTRQITVTSCSIPVVQFTQTIKGDTVFFYGITTNTNDSIHWRLGDGSVHAGDTFTHVYPSHDSTYAVTASIYSSCGADSITKQISVTSVGIKVIGTATTKLYPNPATNSVNLEVSGPATIGLVMANGSSMWQTPIQVSQEGVYVFDMSRYASALYYFIVQYANGKTDVLQVVKK